jgi:hypothetical protein
MENKELIEQKFNRVVGMAMMFYPRSQELIDEIRELETLVQPQQSVSEGDDWDTLDLTLAMVQSIADLDSEVVKMVGHIRENIVKKHLQPNKVEEEK